MPVNMERRPAIFVFLPSYIIAMMTGTNSADILRLVTKIIAS